MKLVCTQMWSVKFYQSECQLPNISVSGASQRTLTYFERRNGITVWLVSSLYLYCIQIMTYFLYSVESNLDKLETIHTAILSNSVSVP